MPDPTEARAALLRIYDLSLAEGMTARLDIRNDARAALAALPDDGLPTAEQQERFKWAANERADRLRDLVRRHGYVHWGPPDFPFPADLAVDGVVPEPTKDDWLAAQPDDDREEASWLIERGQPEKQVPTVWWADRERWGLTYKDNWTTDAFRALRFDSKEAAERVIDQKFTPSIGDPSARAVEHGFIAALPDDRECWFCHRVVPVAALIAGYDTFEEQRLACMACNEIMSVALPDDGWEYAKTHSRGDAIGRADAYNAGATEARRELLAKVKGLPDYPMPSRDGPGTPPSVVNRAAVLRLIEESDV